MRQSSALELLVECIKDGENIALIGPPGCLAGDTPILVRRGKRNSGRFYKIADLYRMLNGGLNRTRKWRPGIFTRVLSLKNGIVKYRLISHATYSGIQPTLIVHIEGREPFRATADHEFLTPNGYRNLGGLSPGDEVVVRGESEKAGRKGWKSRRSVAAQYHPRAWKRLVRWEANPKGQIYGSVQYSWAVIETEMNKLPIEEFLRIVNSDKIAASKLRYIPANKVVHHKDENPQNDERSNLEVMGKKKHDALHGNQNLVNFGNFTTSVAHVISILDHGPESVYDITMADDGAPNFLVNDVVVHNCGKSSLAEQACKIAKRDLVISLPSTEDVTEPGGFPWIAEDRSHATKVLFGQAYKVVHSKKPCLWWWEDFGQANPSVQAAYMQWAWAREVNGHRLPDHVSIGLATNRRTDKAGVSGMLEPVKGRFTLINVESNVDDFCLDLIRRGKVAYGLTEDAIALGCAFIRFRPELLNAFVSTVDMTNSPTERNWVAAFRHVQRKMKPAIELEAVQGRVGQGAAAEFLAFVRVFREMVSLDAILLDPDSAPIPTSPSALYAVSVGLASKVTEGNFGRVARYAQRLYEGNHGEFGVLLVKDSQRRNPKIVNTTSYIEMCCTEIGKLITGEGI